MAMGSVSEANRLWVFSFGHLSLSPNAALLRHSALPALPQVTNSAHSLLSSLRLLSLSLSFALLNFFCRLPCPVFLPQALSHYEYK